MIPDAEAEEKLVDRMLELLGDLKEQETLAANIKQLGISDASERIAGEVKKILGEK